MCHAVLNSSTFWQLLVRIDADLAAQRRAAGCVYCGGRLHSARYPRKPRGAGRALLGEAYASRLSFCCERDGCRRRNTPVSVRFLGRRVFLGALVVLATALAQGLSGQRVALLGEQFGVSLRTLRRWQRWWREGFASSSLWRSLRGRLAVPIAAAALPGALLERCAGEEAAGRVLAVLRLLAPVSAPRYSREGR